MADETKNRNHLTQRQPMAERPINLRAHEVRNALANEVIQVRRVVKGAPADWSPMRPQVFSPTVIDRRGEEQPGPDAYGAGNEDGDCWIVCPYGKPGDRLWGREAFIHEPATYCWEASVSTPAIPAQTVYRADAKDPRGALWAPSIHMPRWASRITLEITEVRVQRLQEISEADAMAEGSRDWSAEQETPVRDIPAGETRLIYRQLWESINGPGSWDADPWVWAMTLMRIA